MQNIILKDDHEIFDRLTSEENPFIKGWVRLFLHKNIKEKGKPIFEGNNLVVGRGREFSAQRMFNNNTGSSNNWKNYIIDSFGVGSGGATISDGTPVINDATLDDHGLFSPISLNASYKTETNSGTTGVIKPISTDGSVELMGGGYGSNTYYSKVKCTCVIAAGEPSGITAGESQQISEAGLYFTSGSTNYLFSHICFAPKWVELDSVLTIEWFVIC